MKWIRVKGKLYNAGQITYIEVREKSDLATIRFSDGQFVDITLEEYDKLTKFCGGEMIEIKERQK
jgi:hypothetical protein